PARSGSRARRRATAASRAPPAAPARARAARRSPTSASTAPRAPVLAARASASDPPEPVQQRRGLRQRALGPAQAGARVLLGVPAVVREVEVEPVALRRVDHRADELLLARRAPGERLPPGLALLRLARPDQRFG